MTDPSLQESLRQLHRELARSPSLDAAARERLLRIVEQVEALAARDAEREGGSASLIEALRGATAHFEESHPALTAAVGRLADALSSLGI
jgi:hypothetical protein